MNREKCTAVVLAKRKRKPDGYKNTEAVSGNMRKACTLLFSCRIWQRSPIIDEIVLVTGEGKTDYCRKNIIEAYGITKVNKIVVGGKRTV